ncbi:PAS domain S-box protein [Caldibacillus lycopersici]|uniref:PAS domain S-box protein n=1 Tax=Perspicuibacillus lycopersici TaxID=1325689 RepID=A0AAE3IQ80_9BACI|nr:sensor domain-containing diguanylate cyclase [Perspicuibacillus lycopersici]MCU9612575.1 PAS domain S-box protein [Perspicuibacillus lycopersici]
MKSLIDNIVQDNRTLTSIFEFFSDLVFFMELEDQSIRYLYLNQPAMRCLNRHENVIGSRIEDVLPKERANILAAKYREVQFTKQTMKFIETIETADGQFIGETTLNPIITNNGQCNYVMGIVRDITEKMTKEQELKATKRKLERNQKRLNSLIENNGDAVFELNLDGNIKKVNDKAIEITGYSEQQLVGTSALVLLAEDKIEDTIANFEEANIETQVVYESWVNHKNGEKLLLLIKNVPIIIDGELDGFFIIAKDITEQNRLQKQIREKSEELEAFWNYSVDPIIYFNINGEIEHVNPAFEETFGYKEAEVKNTKDLLVPFELRSRSKFVWQKIKNGETVPLYETKRITKNGVVLDILASFAPVYESDGKIKGSTAFYKNITELKKAQRNLLESEKKYRIITENASDIIQLMDVSGIIEYVSPSIEKILGYSVHEYIGNHFSIAIHPEDRQKKLTGFQLLKDGIESMPSEIRIKHRDGHYVWMEVTTTHVMEADEIKKFVTIARDITERKKLRDELAKAAFYDYLSGLPNRRNFDEKLTLAIQEAKALNKKIAVMMLDGHKFKRINDTFGHDAGDAVIVEMGKRIQDNIRNIDTVARMGGDEMAIIITKLSTRNDVVEVAERIIGSFQKPFYFNGNKINIGAGIGIAIYPDDSTNQKQLIKYADIALYEEKQSGIDGCRFYSLLEN